MKVSGVSLSCLGFHETPCWAAPLPLFLTLSSSSHLRVEVLVPPHPLLSTPLALDLTAFSGVVLWSQMSPVCVSLVTPHPALHFLQEF